MENAKRNTNIVVTILISLIGLAVLFPFFWMLRSSFMSNIEIHKYPPLLLPTSWRFDNYPYNLWCFSLRYMVNTLTITIPSVLGVLLTSSLAAYAFARLDFPLKRLWFTIVIGTMLMPGAVTIIPIFVAWSRGAEQRLHSAYGSGLPRRRRGQHLPLPAVPHDHPP